jgi:acetylornithine/succinyldiaminopimelate/putrescine aminotransferase
LRLPNDQVVRHTQRYLDLIAGQELTTEGKQAFIAETVDSYEKYYNRGFISYRKSVTQAGQFAALEWAGQGSLLVDLLGREYIDCLGGYGIFSAGVNHPRVVKAVTDQLQRMALNSQELLEPWRAALSKVLAEVTPGDLQNSFFINNGTDAIEGAIKLTRLYTKRNTFISALGGFHGKSMGSLSLMGKASFREPFQFGLQDVRFVPYGDADALEYEFQRCEAVGVGIAGVVLEPVQGEAGGVVPPSDYFPRARELCTKYGALLIADEIQTGMGRTGKMFGFQHEGIQPDAISVAKALGNGLPIGAMLCSEAAGKSLPSGTHGSTFGGNLVAATAANVVVRHIRDPQLLREVQEKGEYFIARGRELQGRLPTIVKDVRGRGLLIGVELNQEAAPVIARCREQGLLVNAAGEKTVRFAPAYTVTREELDEGLRILERVLTPA